MTGISIPSAIRKLIQILSVEKAGSAQYMKAMEELRTMLLEMVPRRPKAVGRCMLSLRGVARDPKLPVRTRQMRMNRLIAELIGIRPVKINLATRKMAPAAKAAAKAMPKKQEMGKKAKGAVYGWLGSKTALPPPMPAPAPEAPAAGAEPATKAWEPEAQIYNVWYGTNRRPIDAGNAWRGYSDRRESDPRTVHHGMCEVTIPQSHNFGELGSPWYERWMTLTDDRLKLRRIIGSTEAEFWASVRKELDLWGESERQALVYLHGYNVIFEEAAIRAAQIGFDLKAQGVTAFFSWPSKGTAHEYPADEASIEASEDAIAEFMARFVEHVGADRVHVIAHSMGNRGLLRAMQRILSDAERRSRVKFGQIFLAAPDVDADVFGRLAEAYPSRSVRTTLYVSPTDKAVGLSKWLHGFARAGFMPPVTIVQGIDTVAVPDFDLDVLGHAYFAEAAAVLHDIFDVLHFNAPPQKRQRLRKARRDDGKEYWTMLK